MLANKFISCCAPVTPVVAVELVQCSYSTFIVCLVGFVGRVGWIHKTQQCGCICGLAWVDQAEWMRDRLSVWARKQTNWQKNDGLIAYLLTSCQHCCVGHPPLQGNWWNTPQLMRESVDRWDPTSIACHHWMVWHCDYLFWGCASEASCHGLSANSKDMHEELLRKQQENTHV